ncbi:hypothetical protein A2U01_0046630 [Trifolium medium]|uniref:Uncharacterized protein n=1 Tax=Trifolium medium TaxID=97028 RepID=A0A392QNB0_9FABA|nr:hypothetical protein [Trifolium medium]
MKLKKMILEEGHGSGLSIHPGKSKIEHQKPSGLLQLMFIPEWKLTKSAHFIAFKTGTLIEIQDSHRDFGRVFKKLLEPS